MRNAFDPLLAQTFDKAAISHPWINGYRDRSVTELEIRHAILDRNHDFGMSEKKSAPARLIRLDTLTRWSATQPVEVICSFFFAFLSLSLSYFVTLTLTALRSLTQSNSNKGWCVGGWIIGETFTIPV